MREDRLDLMCYMQRNVFSNCMQFKKITKKAVLPKCMLFIYVYLNNQYVTTSYDEVYNIKM